MAKPKLSAKKSAKKPKSASPRKPTRAKRAAPKGPKSKPALSKPQDPPNSAKSPNRTSAIASGAASAVTPGAPSKAARRAIPDLQPRYDMVVIGSGPGGQRAALQGAKAGKQVLIIEENTAGVGGGCVYSGTLPSKSFRESVYRYALGSRGRLGQENEAAEAAAAAGKPITALRVSVPLRKLVLPEMKRLLRRCLRVVENESKIIADQLQRNSITILHGRARVTAPTTIEVTVEAGRMLTVESDFIFVAVGARPVSPPHLQSDGKYIFDSNDILTLDQVPKAMVVLGAGIIGCEYASMFSMAGTQVYLVDRRPEILASVDREIVQHLSERFHHEGMELILGTEATQVTRAAEKSRGKSEGIIVHLSNGRKVAVDAVLVALGRQGNTEGLGLREVGVQVDDRGLVKVDRYFKTSVPSIYAVGDVVGAPALASTSMEQGRVACAHAFGIADISGVCELGMSANFPYGIYTIPEISMVGPTEEALREAGAEFVVGRARYKELARGQIVGDRWGLLKLLVDRNTQKLLGVHIIGDNAADLVHIGQAVMYFHGDIHYFIKSVFNYPTLAEAYKTAAFHAINQIRGTTTTR